MYRHFVLEIVPPEWVNVDFVVIAPISSECLFMRSVQVSFAQSHTHTLTMRELRKEQRRKNEQTTILNKYMDLIETPLSYLSHQII